MRVEYRNEEMIDMLALAKQIKSFYCTQTRENIMTEILTSSIFNETFGTMRERCDADDFFKKLSESISLARTKTGKVLSKKGMPKSVRGMYHLFKKGALTVVILSKKDSLEGCPRLSGWIAGERIRINNAGSYHRVEGCDQGAFFTAIGDFDLLKGMAEKYLTEKMHGFEDDRCIVWL